MLYPVHEFQKVALATSALKGQALSWFKCIGKNLLGEPGSPTYTYENFKNSLVKASPVVRDRARLEAKLFSRYQEKIEDLSNFILRKIQVFKLLYGSRWDPEIIQIILPRLLPQVQDFIELRNPTTLDKLFELAVQFESRRTADNERRRQFERRSQWSSPRPQQKQNQSVDVFSLAEAKIDFKGGELTLNMKPIETKKDTPPQLDLQHLPAEEKEKIQGLDPRQSNSTEDVLQRKKQEPATTASKSQKKKAPPQQSKNQKCGFKRKTDDAEQKFCLNSSVKYSSVNSEVQNSSV
ncbi:hypothetical protein X975_01426, partial [Stegodyphus mimosarum]